MEGTRTLTNGTVSTSVSYLIAWNSVSSQVRNRRQISEDSSTRFPDEISSSSISSRMHFLESARRCDINKSKSGLVGMASNLWNVRWSAKLQKAIRHSDWLSRRSWIHGGQSFPRIRSLSCVANKAKRAHLGILSSIRCDLPALHRSKSVEGIR